MEGHPGWFMRTPCSAQRTGNSSSAESMVEFSPVGQPWDLTVDPVGWRVQIHPSSTLLPFFVFLGLFIMDGSRQIYVNLLTLYDISSSLSHRDR